MLKVKKDKAGKVRPQWDKTKHGLRNLQFLALKVRAFRLGEREKRRRKKEE